MINDKRGKVTPAGIFVSIISIVAIIGIVFFAKWAVGAWGDVGYSDGVVLDIPVEVPTFLGGPSTEGILAVLFSPSGVLTWQLLLLGIVTVMILGVAFVDIMTLNCRDWCSRDRGCSSFSNSYFCFIESFNRSGILTRLENKKKRWGNRGESYNRCCQD